jgi:hypothetical protein
MAEFWEPTRSQGARARQRLSFMCCNRPRPQSGLGHFPHTGSSVARPAVAIKSARPGITGLRTFVVATYRTSWGCSYNPGTPALIKRRSSLHEPGGSESQPHWNPAGALETCGAPLVPLWTFSRCWLLRREGSDDVLDGLGQQQVPGR